MPETPYMETPEEALKIVNEMPSVLAEIPLGRQGIASAFSDKVKKLDAALKDIVGACFEALAGPANPGVLKVVGDMLDKNGHGLSVFLGPMRYYIKGEKPK